MLTCYFTFLVYTILVIYNIQLFITACLQEINQDNDHQSGAYVNLNMPILAIHMFPSQHRIRRRTLEHLDRSACIEPTSRNNHFNLSSVLVPIQTGGVTETVRTG